MRIKGHVQCNAVIQPGEYTIGIWDGQRCAESSAIHLARCEECGRYYCLTMHWYKHVKDIHTP